MWVMADLINFGLVSSVLNHSTDLSEEQIINLLS